jgi:hypothetical protein
MSSLRARAWLRPLLLVACLGFVATSVSGCIIVPDHHWHARYW